MRELVTVNRATSHRLVEAGDVVLRPVKGQEVQRQRHRLAAEQRAEHILVDRVILHRGIGLVHTQLRQTDDVEVRDRRKDGRRRCQRAGHEYWVGIKRHAAHSLGCGLLRLNVEDNLHT